MPSKTASASEKGSITRAAGVVGFYTLLSRILGLARDMVFARFFGSGMAADAFFVAFRIPNVLRRLFAEGSLTIAFIPVFTEYLTTRTKEEAFDLARVVLTLLALVLCLVTLAGIVLAPWVVRLQAFGFGAAGAKYELTVLLTRIMFPYILLVSLVAFFMGVLNSLRRFAAPAAAPIFLNVGIIGAAYLLSPYMTEPIAGIAVGVIIGGILQVLLQLPSLAKEGCRLFPRWNLAHPGLRKIGRLMLPSLFGSAVYQLNQFLGTLLASFLPEGSVSWLYYADRLVEFPLGVFGIALSTAALPSLSTQAAQKDTAGFEATLSHALHLIFFISLPATVGLVLLAEPLIAVFFQRGAFDAEATRMTAVALWYYAAGLWAFSALRILVSAFYALQDARTPVVVATAALVANVSLGLLLMGPMRHGGLALALSLASSLQFVLLFWLLRRRLGGRLGHRLRVSLLKYLAAATAMGLAVYACQSLAVGDLTGRSLVVQLGGVMALVGLGVGVYLGAAWALRCPEVGLLKDVARGVRRRLGRARR